MNDNMKAALLKMYSDLEEAEKNQALRGGHDQGARAQVTSGKHLFSVAKVIRENLIKAGYDPNDVYYQEGCLRLPGWFRPSKDWDLIALHDKNLLAAVELKSINSSFGNNANNRTEESLGSAIDAEFSIKNELIPFQTRPPLLGYVLVVRLCDQSTCPVKNRQKTLYPIDEVFEKNSYFKRLSTMCRRLLSEKIYGAVWIVGVNPVTGEIEEPESDLTYDKFIKAIESQLLIHKA